MEITEKNHRHTRIMKERQRERERGGEEKAISTPINSTSAQIMTTQCKSESKRHRDGCVIGIEVFGSVFFSLLQMMLLLLLLLPLLFFPVDTWMYYNLTVKMHIL